MALRPAHSSCAASHRNRPSQQPLRGHQSHASDKLVERGATAPLGGRLKQTTTVLGTTGYEVNAQGERVRKSGPTGDRIYHYDRQGRLIGEGTALGQIDREYIYLHDLPVAVIVE